ncbi:aldehyde dehydrogenase family 3 member B1 isoform X2 [Aplysia californica]|uniref:Aldehyde dehydrogenase n=1 Tax=Aplysia californica TaxID=6500 RepID=A0ABM0JXR3_APLCA|nr:aldehyde dehydrogenase family 3 member B1 isoform X1 [Aplysia californica]XP_005104005.1 aldehyde dehydrogenase family 3 member B1 isoform X2 [Aplysia californica]
MYELMMKDVRSAFATGKTRTYEWRISQLKAIMRCLQENSDKINEVLFKDLHKHSLESVVMEANMCVSEAIDCINNLKDWMKPEKVSKPALYMMDTAYIQSEPYGVALIIGAWNYPIQLTLLPLIGAIAAGNCVVLKPSEVSAASAQFLQDYLPKYVDNDCIKVVNGAVPETTALLKEKFDFIMYTGNSFVARIVMEAASKHLTPVLLELGGKSPAYVDKGTDMEVVARRLCWGKFANAGQTCVAPDYVMCQKDMQDELIKNLKATIEAFYTADPKSSDSFGRIVNEKHFQRVQKLKKGAEVAVGGGDVEEEKYIAPTVLRDVKLTDPVMQDEIFGPLLPIMPVQDHAEAIKIINDRDKPLSLYVFSNNKSLIQEFRLGTSSGAFLVNDTVVHGGLNTLPFGGVGNSGMGRYHGKHSFDSFSHQKAVLEKSLALDSVNQLRYPPYSDTKLGWLQWIMKKKVKRTGVFSFLPFVVMGAMFAMFYKTAGVMADSVGAGQDNGQM